MTTLQVIKSLTNLDPSPENPDPTLENMVNNLGKLIQVSLVKNRMPYFKELFEVVSGSTHKTALL